VYDDAYNDGSAFDDRAYGNVAGRGWNDSGADACGAGYNDGDQGRGGGSQNGAAPRGGSSSTRFAGRGYEAPAHREHMHSLRETQQYHRRNPVKDGSGDLSDPDGDFDDAFLP